MIPLTTEQKEKIKTMSGQELFRAMKWAYDNNHLEAIDLLRKRAEEINKDRYRNTFDVRTVLIFLGAIGWLLISKDK